MKKYFLAKTIKGKEYIYSRDSAMLCSEQSRLYLLDLLNSKKYQLKNDNETWHLYENDWYTNDYISKEIIRTKTRVFVRGI